ncbi:MAG: ACT domain-containing protein [Chitinispirillaceae bacterium]|nr:ACT domain-containing protein [Chitinispirillaceae bacterium]
MARERLFIIHGMGPDAVGLVGRITDEMARHKGNIVDLRQDVLHGLFIIYLVVDLSDADLRIEEFNGIVDRLSEDTGISLQVDTYNPVARNPEKKNMLLILLGADHPGIIASISQLLGKYGINIEFASNIGREGVFLMELMTDISTCTIPLENVMNTVSTAMAGQGIKALFQTDAVFNKKKRVILFDSTTTLMDERQRQELLQQAALDGATLDRLLHDDSAATIAAQLEGLPRATYESMLTGLHATPETIELLQTLKTMGYTIGLISSASSQLVDTLAAKLGIDYAFGIPYETDDDTQAFTGSIACEFSGINRQSIILAIVNRERISAEEVTIINTGKRQELTGIHPVFNLGAILELYNKRGISKELLTAAIASFGFMQP